MDGRILDRRIKNLTRTRQVTYAMQMIASIKLKRVQKQAEAGQRYRHELEIAADMFTSHRRNLSGRRLLIVIATDRGFAGNANQMVSDYLRSRLEDKRHGRPDEIVAVGRYALRLLKKEGLLPALTIKLNDTPSLDDMAPLVKFLLARLQDDPGLTIGVLSLRFVSFGRQLPALTQVYPPKQENTGQTIDAGEDYLFEPKPEKTAEMLLPRLVNASLLALVREAKASEHAIRMQAMRQASDSADEMIASLSLQRSRLRQQRITQEILEIVGDQTARCPQIKEHKGNV